VDASDHTLGYELHGQGPSCLLLHGFTGTPAELWPLAEAMAARGYRVSAPLLPGHGIGAKDLLVAGRNDWFGIASEALQKLPKPVGVVGLSMGALLATRLAAGAQVNRLVLLAPAAELRLPAALLTWAAHVVPSLPRRFPGMRVKAESDLRDPTLRSTNPKNDVVSLFGLAELHRLQREALEAASSVTVPTLICLGARDRTITRRGALRLVRRLRGPVRVERFAHSGHQLVLDYDRRLVIDAVLAHFAPLMGKVG
jgi:carboxylesterase